MPVKGQFEVLQGMFPTMWIRATWLKVDDNCAWARACMQFLSIWSCCWWDDRCSPEGSPPWPGLGHQSVPGQSIVWCGGDKSKDGWGAVHQYHHPRTVGTHQPHEGRCCQATKGTSIHYNSIWSHIPVPTSSQFLWPACNGWCGPLLMCLHQQIYYQR